MTKQERLILIKRAIEDNFIDVIDLVEMLELSVEDIVFRYPERLLENEDKFIIIADNDDTLTDEEIEEYEWKEEYISEEEC